MASGPITPWQIDGKTMETLTDFCGGGSKITADGDCSHEIKRRLLLGRKSMPILDSILKNREPAKVEGNKGFLPQPKKDLESPSSMRLEVRFPYPAAP